MVCEQVIVVTSGWCVHPPPQVCVYTPRVPPSSNDPGPEQTASRTADLHRRPGRTPLHELEEPDGF